MPGGAGFVAGDKMLETPRTTGSFKSVSRDALSAQHQPAILEAIGMRANPAIRGEARFGVSLIVAELITGILTVNGAY